MAFEARTNVRALPRPLSANDDRRPNDFPEIDCVRAFLPADAIADAQERAARLGIGADRVLTAGGWLSEDDYARAFAQGLGAAFEPLDDMPRAFCALADERLIEAARAGLLPLSIDDALSLVVAPRGTAARRIAALIQNDPTLARRFRFTSDERLARFVLRGAGKTLAARAVDLLHKEKPGFSAAPPANFLTVAAPIAALGLTGLAATLWAPSTAAFVFELIPATLFTAWLGLRVASAFLAPAAVEAATAPAAAELPVYSVMAALYREAASVDGLLRAIERLDYPGLR